MAIWTAKTKDECFTVSSEADLHGLLRQFEATAE